MKPIKSIAGAMRLEDSQWIPYGHFKAKLNLELIKEKPKGKLILVTAITPNKAGVGKTTTSIALSQGMQSLGLNAIAALREPSLGPCFGQKGGATGGGLSQIHPADDINLHFNGDFHAITTAHNMLSALLDNYKYFNPRALKQITWKRVLDINDRQLRNVLTGLGGSSHGVPTESGFDITPASEIMALFCLAESYADLEKRIHKIVLGYTYEDEPFTVADLNVGGAIMALLKDAFMPNLVQTTEGTPVLVHGGPFANIAHGCNSVIATKMALSLADYVITEAGFGADLGGEKFMNIKCRISGLNPAATVIVVSSQALKLHGGTPEANIKNPDKEGLQRGLLNLGVHIENMKAFGPPVVVAFNTFPFDYAEEIQIVADWCKHSGAAFAENTGFAQGGKGAEKLAQTIVDLVNNSKDESQVIKHTYDLEDTILQKIEKVVTQIYRGKGINLSKKAKQKLKKIEALGLSHLPICMAKTQYSFSGDPLATGIASDFILEIDDLVINSGAGFIVVIAGEIMRMPGLPKSPQALQIRMEGDAILGLS